MPFFLIERSEQHDYQTETGEKNSQQIDNIPLFLIPGIVGVGAEYQHLIQQLRSAGETRPIYVYYDPAILSDQLNNDPSKGPSLQEQAKLIADNMKEHLKPGPHPYLLVGYSYGCSLATLAAQELATKNLDCHTYLIDGPSPEVSKNYFSTNSKSVLDDIIKIVKYTATLSCPDIATQINNTSISLSALVPMPTSPLTLMDMVAEILKEENISLSANPFFDKYFSVAKQGIHNLLNYAAPTPSKKLSKLVTVITHETSEKYRSSYGGWENYTEKLSIVTDEHIRYQQHMELLKGNEDPRLANSIMRFINSATNAELLINTHLEYLLKTYYEPQFGSDISPELSSYTSSESGSSTPTSIESFSDDEDNSDEFSPNKHKKVNAITFLRSIENFKRKVSLFGESASTSPPNDTLGLDDHSNPPNLYDRRIRATV